MMSLFPAYAEKDGAPKSEKHPGFVRLENITVPCIPIKSSSEGSSSTESEGEIEHVSITKKRSLSPEKKSHKRRKTKEVKCTVEEDILAGLEKLCFIDITPGLSTARPKKKRKKNKFHKERYYTGFKMEDVDDNLLLCGEEILKMTQEFNVKLQDDPDNVKLWLDYVNFQDSVIKEKKPKVDKKLAILEKAVFENPGDPDLYEEMFKLMDSIYSFDSMFTEVKKIVSREPKNLVAWKWYINVHLFNVTKVTFPIMRNVFEMTLEAQFRAYSTNSEPILDTVLKCCLFLRQAGLWENLWTVVQLTLELNFSSTGSGVFNSTVKIPESEIREMEDRVVTSGLPLTELWLRVEYLRQCCHFLPLDTCEDDPFRTVDLTELGHLVRPIHASSSLRLITILLTSLKVPLLPATDCAIRLVGVHNLPWALESPEFILSALAHPYLPPGSDGCLEVCRELLVAPQYLEDKPCSGEFFNAVSELFEKIVSSTQGEMKAAVGAWLMRWWGWVGRRDCASRAKRLMRLHRDIIPLYTEYSILMERQGDLAAARKVMGTAVAFRSPPLDLPASSPEAAHLMHLYRVYMELLFRSGLPSDKEEGQRVVERLGGLERLEAACLEELAGNDWGDEVGPEAILLPPRSAGLIGAAAAALCLLRSQSAALEFLHRAIEKLVPFVPSQPSTLTQGKIVLESLLEQQVWLLHSSHTGTVVDLTPLRTTLRQASQFFPNNLFFLHVAYLTETILSKFWNMSRSFTNDSVFMKLYTVLAYRDKMVSGDHITPDQRGESQRRVYRLVSRYVEGAAPGRLPPLLWRLLLQFVASQRPADIKATFCKAVDSSPWVKAVYYDAGQCLPEEMHRIQDLMIEKELRLHATLEELEVLRQPF